MKRFLLVMATAALLVMHSSLGEAWEVKVKNSCHADVEIFVKGHDLTYFVSVDCKVKGARGETGICRLRGGLCSSKISGHYYVKDSSGKTYEEKLDPIFCTTPNVFFKTATCCWNVNAEVTTSGHCRLELR